MSWVDEMDREGYPSPDLCGREDDDPEPITLTWRPPPSRARSALNWAVLAFFVGAAIGWTAFL